MNDNQEHPREDVDCHRLQFRVGVGVVFVALDEEGTTGCPGEAKDRNGDGNHLGEGDGAGGENYFELDDTLGARF